MMSRGPSRISKSWALPCCLAFCWAAFSHGALAADPLPSWNADPTKEALLRFVAAVTQPQSPQFVNPAERIAVFDNDGTLWAEQPVYVQAEFAVERVKELAPQHPEWQAQEPFKALLAGDLGAVATGGEKAAAEIVMATHAGMTTEEFQSIVLRWITTARHPRFHRAYTELAYEPMLELLRYLRAKGFKTFVVSGGGVEFIRPWAERVYGVPPEQVVGSTIRLQYQLSDAGKPVLARLAQIDAINDGPEKPVGIQRAIGRRPILAFGNSDGDREMLEWTASGPGARFAALIHHTDASREWAYDRDSRVGKLDTALQEARNKGWLIVDMKTDWKRVFAFEPQR
jgi:hypothetical protein